MICQLRVGWLVACCAGVMSLGAWLPWLTTMAGGGGWANAIGGTYGSLELPLGFGAGQLSVLLSSMLVVTGAMVGRGLSVMFASIAALALSLLSAALIVWYYRLNVNPPVAAEYGLYICMAAAMGAVGCSLWAVVSAALGGQLKSRNRA